MPMSATVAGTPYYVLMSGNRPIGPRVVRSHPGIECSLIYGFSGKGPYDKSCMESQLALTPYPLVKGYLRQQATVGDVGFHLVVVDAPGPCEACVYAATTQAVLDAQENQSAHVTTAFRLSFDPEAKAYRVEESSV